MNIIKKNETSISSDLNVMIKLMIVDTMIPNKMKGERFEYISSDINPITMLPIIAPISNIPIMLVLAVSEN